MTFEQSEDVAWEPLFTEQLYAVVHREHPLATRQLIDFDELSDQPFVAVDPEETLRKIFDAACARHGIAPTIAFEGTDITTLRGLIGARLGVGILPRAPITSPDIVEIAVDDKQLVRTIAVGWMANRYLPPSAAHFRDSALASHQPEDRPTSQVTVGGARGAAASTSNRSA
jgi:LysR family transcriptional activator of glutamate synthase operon